MTVMEEPRTIYRTRGRGKRLSRLPSAGVHPVMMIRPGAPLAAARTLDTYADLFVKTINLYSY
jgi:hypothetical protein